MKSILCVFLLLSAFSVWATVTISKVVSTGSVMVDTGDSKKVKGDPMLGLTSGGLFVPIAVDDSGRIITVGTTSSTTTTTSDGM